MSFIQLEDKRLDEEQSKRRSDNGLLRLENLTVDYEMDRGLFGGRSPSVTRALDNVSFDVGESEFVALVGESGSGKSTIAKCITLLTKPTRGSIFYKGKDVSKLRGEELVNYRKEVQIVYQDPFESLNPSHDVFRIVSTPLRRLKRLTAEDKIHQEVSRLLEEVGLDATIVMRKFPHQLSGGERQRVNIARALAPDPRLLIADEPMTMLDASQRFNILSLLFNLKTSRNFTILMITHDLASAKLCSDRIIVIYLGKIMEIGNGKDVVSRPMHPYVEMIMNAIPHSKWLSGKQQQKDTIPSIEESMIVRTACVFAPRCKYATNTCREVEPKLEAKSEARYCACHYPLSN